MDTLLYLTYIYIIILSVSGLEPKIDKLKF